MTVGYIAPSDIEYLMVHCTDSPNSLGDARLDTAADIHRWHTEKGYDLIGYHIVILEDGEIQLGRPEYCKGAHCPKVNSRSLAVCLIGEDEFNEDQLLSLRVVLTQWLQKYPGAKVIGHRDVDPTRECPGFDVKPWWEKVSREYP